MSHAPQATTSAPGDMKTIEICWQASMSASCLHAAEGLCRRRTVVDQAFAEALTEPTAQLAAAIKALELPAARFWRHVTALCAGIDNNQQLAEIALRKTIGMGDRAKAAIPRVALAITELENAGRAAAPKLLEELALRGEPLKMQWDARGRGLLRRVAQITDERLMVERTEVVLVHPTFGGGGAAHLPYNTVRIEALLANANDALPEMVRLGWYIAQLNLNLPMFSEQVPADRLPHVAALAMLPPVLTAAEHVELARCDADTLQSALDAWDVRVPQDLDMTATLLDWWDTFTDSRPAWSTALVALDRMIG
ncbi:MAG: hypothetical protein RIC55_34730 [Pirellulaceae bacterium]